MMLAAAAVVAAAGACGKDSSQQGFPASRPSGPRLPLDAPPALEFAPADPLGFERKTAPCIAAAAVRDVNQLGIARIVSEVVKAWMTAPPETATIGLAAIEEAAPRLVAHDARAVAYGALGQAYLTLDRRDPAKNAFGAALAAARVADPLVRVDLWQAIEHATEGLARLGETAAVDEAVTAFPFAAAAAAAGYARAGARDAAEAMLAREVPREVARQGSAASLRALALVLLGRADDARRAWADDVPREAALSAAQLARAVAEARPAEALAYIDEAEAALARATGVASDLHAGLAIELARLRHAAGDVDGAARRRAAIATKLDALGKFEQYDRRAALAEAALAAGDVAAAEAALVRAVDDSSFARSAMLLLEVRLGLHRRDYVAASIPLYTVAGSPGHIGYATLVAGYRAVNDPDVAAEQRLLPRICPRY